MQELHWDVLLEPQYVSILLGGLETTVLLSCISTVIGLLLGCMFAAGRTSQSAGAKQICGMVCDAIRSVPGVFWLVFFFFALPPLLPGQGALLLNGWEGYPFACALVGLSINLMPQMADVLCSVMETAGKNALDAARLSGLRGFNFWGRVAFPQAFAAGMPALSLRVLQNFKNTSIAMVISVPDLTWSSQEVEALSFAGFEVTTATTCIYLFLGALLSGLLAIFERRLEKEKLPS